MSDEKELIIVRGSTPLLAITLPEDISTSDIATGIISISQRKKGVLISKTLDEMTVDGNKYSVFLKQSETLKLDSTRPAAIQAKFCTIDDIVLVSFIQNIEILPVNNEKLFEQDNPSGDTYEATGESGIEIVPDLVNFTPDMDVEQVVIHTDDYKLLRNKPSINGVVLLGDKSSDEFGIYSSTQVDALFEPIVEKETEQDTSISEIDEKVQTIQNDVNTLKTDAVKSVNNVKPVSGNVTIAKADIGLANVTNDVQVKRSEMGAANGVATLDTNGVIPSAQLPSYVDDVLEYSTASAFPSKGESGKIYIAIDTNLSYRWSGTRYTKIASDLALGETSSTAYAGDKGKAVRDDLNTHVADNSRHITSAERTTWNGKQDKLTAGENITIDANNVISATGGGGYIDVDSELSSTSTNPVQNKVITNALNSKANTSSLASVATTGSYNDLSNKPTIPTVPTKVSAFTNDAGYITSVPSEYVTETELNTALSGKANTADLATVATSGSYEDLTNKPTIPTVPTNVSAFTNDAHYITASGAPVQSVNGQTGAVTVPDTDTKYTLSMSGNVITLTPSSGTASSITLPVYSGGVSA